MISPASILLLHIEDEATLAELFAVMLRREAARHDILLTVEWAQTLNDGLERARRIPAPDLILLDLGLPFSAPHETIARIPELERYGPVHVLTGRAEQDVHDAVAKLGVGLSDKRDAFGSILERGIGAMLDWFPKSRRAQERETRLQLLDGFAANLRSRIHDATH